MPGIESARDGGKVMKRVLHIGLVALFVVALPARGHHSFSAVFDSTQPVAVMGKIVRVEWLNPHIWFYVEVSDSDGEVTEWGFSGAPPGVLMRRGILKSVLEIGSVVNVEGFRARDGSTNASAGRVTFADGRNVFTASSEDQLPDSTSRQPRGAR